MKKRRYPASAIGLAICLMIGFCALALFEPAPMRALRNLVFDQYQVWSPRVYEADHPVRIVAIDDQSLAIHGQWPWPRAQLAHLVERIAADQPAVIVLDLLLSEPERGGIEGDQRLDDQRLAEALRASPAIVGQVLMHGAGRALSKAGFSEAGDDPRPFLPDLSGAVVPLAPLSNASAGIGALNFLPERDFVVRKVPLVLKAGTILVPGLAAETLRVALGADSFVIRASNAGGQSAFGASSGINALRIADLVAQTEKDGGLRVHFTGVRPERSLSAQAVLKNEIVTGSFRGKIVLIGATASALADLRATPLDASVAGVEIHAEAIEHLLAGNRLARPDYAAGLEAALVILLGGLGLVIGLALPPLAAGIGGVMLASLAPIGSWLAFTQSESLFDPFPILLCVIASASLAAFSRWRAADLERMETRAAFSRYVSPIIVERLVADPSRLVLGGETRKISVLFADLHDFTRISEEMPADAVIALLNRVHEPLTQIVLETGGTIDKFLGDGLMAFWNAPTDQPDHAALAIKAAKRMVDAVLRLSTSEAPLAIGIGIATGKASVGNLGATQRFDYSAVGDTVNVAARIEPLTRSYGLSILLDETTALAGGHPVRQMDVVTLKGRSVPSMLYTVS